MCSTIGYLRKFIATQTEEIFGITEDENRLYFNLGNISGVDTDDQNFDKVKETINNHLNLFPDRTFIYYGWQITEFMKELKEEYPHSKFYGIRIADKFNESMVADWVAISYDVGRNVDILTDRIKKHNDMLDAVWDSGKIQIDEKQTTKIRKCFHFYE
jgi:hypothetical protein